MGRTTRLRAAVSRQRTLAGRVQRAEREIERLRIQVSALQEAADEDRSLHRRLAELTDVVQFSLLPGSGSAAVLEDPLDTYFDDQQDGSS